MSFFKSVSSHICIKFILIFGAEKEPSISMDKSLNNFDFFLKNLNEFSSFMKLIIVLSMLYILFSSNLILPSISISAFESLEEFAILFSSKQFLK